MPAEPDLTSKRVRERQRDGYVVVIATEPHRAPEMFAKLKGLIGTSAGGVLVVMERPAPWAGGPVVAVAPRSADGVMGVGCWLGPLTDESEQHAVLRWLRRGGPAAIPLPAELRHRILHPGRPAAPLQTMN